MVKIGPLIWVLASQRTWTFHMKGLVRTYHSIKTVRICMSEYGKITYLAESSWLLGLLRGLPFIYGGWGGAFYRLKSEYLVNHKEGSLSFFPALTKHTCTCLNLPTIILKLLSACCRRKRHGHQLLANIKANDKWGRREGHLLT